MLVRYTLRVLGQLPCCRSLLARYAGQLCVRDATRGRGLAALVEMEADTSNL